MLIRETREFEAVVSRTGFWSWLFPDKIVATFGYYLKKDTDDPEAWTVMISEWYAEGHEDTFLKLKAMAELKDKDP